MIRAKGLPPDEAEVFLFSTSPQMLSHPRRNRVAVVSADGKFTFDAVPAGEYFLVAVDGRKFEDWLVPSKLELLRQKAVRINVGESSQGYHELVIERTP